MPRAAGATTRTEKAKPKAVGGEGKGKRQPSAYNIYVKEHLKKWKEAHPERAIKEGMAEVAALWRNAPENPKRGATEATAKTTTEKTTTEKKKSSSRSKASAASEEKEAED